MLGLQTTLPENWCSEALAHLSVQRSLGGKIIRHNFSSRNVIPLAICRLSCGTRNYDHQTRLQPDNNKTHVIESEK